MDGIGGGSRKERFAGFNRDDDEAPDYIDLDKDGDKKSPRKGNERQKDEKRIHGSRP